ncbi:MAG: ATP-binding cassette domain-containing protein, partial [Nitriliruptorales bacterium]|nr:ATP-binding cassette domain-containing protein [Nitriliruptorales bacterium]
VSGAVGGAIVGLGGAALAAASGSVVPAGFALPFTAAIVVAGLVAGAPPWGPPTATLLVWGFPVLVAWLPGEAVGALAGGVIGLIVLAVRHGRPLWPWRSRHLDVAVPDTASTARRGGAGVLEVDLPALSEGRIRFEAQPGEIVVLVGPNGSGKSTLLAQIGGQLPDGGGVRLRGKPLPRGAASRAGAGVARTWQRDPSLPDDDAVVTAVSTEEDRRAMAQAAAIVGGHGADDLLRLAARRPAVALLDEPAASHPPRVVRALLRHLARVGTVVVVAEHEPRTAAIADQVIRLERT